MLGAKGAVICIWLGILVCPLALPQQIPQAQPGTPILRSTTRLVEVNVIVQGKGGLPVSGLKLDDFIVTDNGKPQKIAVFSENSTDPLPVAALLPPNTFTNRLDQKKGTPSSITVILLDSLNTSFADQAYAKAQVIKFLQHLRPEDHIGIYALGRSLRVLHDYTTDSSRLLRQLAAYTGQNLPDLQASEPTGGLDGDTLVLDEWLRGGGGSALEQDFFVTNRAVGTLRSLEFIASHLARVPGRKTLIWVSGGFPLSIGFDSRPSPGSMQRTFSADLDRTVRAVNNANLAIYPVDARGLMTDPRFSAQQQRPINVGQSRGSSFVGVVNQGTMEVIASRTGGRAYYNRNDLMGAIRDAVGDSRITYTIGYYPSGGLFDGKFHEIKVRAKPSGLKLRYRRGYFDLAEPPQDERLRRAELRDAVFSPLDATEVGMTVSIRPAGGGSLEVAVRIEPRGIGLAQQDGRWNGKLDVLFIQMDPQGRQYNGRDETIELRLKQSNYDRLVRGGLTYQQVITRALRATQLRVVVRDTASGAIGSVSVPFSELRD